MGRDPIYYRYDRPARCGQAVVEAYNDFASSLMWHTIHGKSFDSRFLYIRMEVLGG